MLSALEPRALQMDAPSVAPTEASPMSTLVADEFYNVAEMHRIQMRWSRGESRVGGLLLRNGSGGRLKNES